MTTRRRRRDRRARQPDHPEPPRPMARRQEDRKRAAFEARLARLRKNRNVMFVVFLLSLPFVFLCAPGPLDCKLPPGMFGIASAGLLGLGLGYVLRMYRETRAFRRETGAA